MDREIKYNLIRQNAIVALFFGFLKINNVYHEFLANYKEQGRWKEDYYQLETTLKNAPHEAINYSFYWRGTPQGYNFWNAISENLHDFLLKFNIYYEKQKNIYYEKQKYI